MGLFKKILDKIFNNKQTQENPEISVNPISKEPSKPTESIAEQLEKKKVKIVVKTKTFVNLRTIPLNIGIDFGTSYTKACFSDLPDLHEFVKFSDGDEFRPTVIYYNFSKKILYYMKPEDLSNIETIEYFKYSMVKDGLPRNNHLNNENLNIRPEILCSIFFLASLIKELKQYINDYYSKKISSFKIDLSFTMGVPIENYDKEEENVHIYDKVLHIAVKLSDELKENSISLSDLYKFYENNQNIPIFSFGATPINTLPELYAESLAFLSNRNIPFGAYALVDIGGGTVDMAIMCKSSQEEFNISSKDICPLGIEVVSSQISKQYEYIDKVKNQLKDFRIIGHSSYVSESEEASKKKELQQSFARLVVDTKKKNVRVSNNNSYINILRLHNGRLPIIICGGGFSYEWYKDGIIQNQDNLRNILEEKLKLEIIPIERLFPSNFNINHRLLIAYALSTRIEDIPQIKGFPWNFAIKENYKDSETRFENYYKLQQATWEKYGEYN
jgi:hypothetical protein